jgi:hypothetical protein
MLRTCCVSIPVFFDIYTWSKCEFDIFWSKLHSWSCFCMTYDMLLGWNHPSPQSLCSTECRFFIWHWVWVQRCLSWVELSTLSSTQLNSWGHNVNDLSTNLSFFVLYFFELFFTVQKLVWGLSSSLLKLVPMYAWSWVWKWGPHKCPDFLSMLSVSEVWENKLYLSLYSK